MTPEQMRSAMQRLGIEHDRPNGPKPLTEAIISELQAIRETYEQPCPFGPGDLVTPRRGRALKGAGEPHIVLEVFDPPLRRTVGEHGTTTELGRVDMRIACWVGGCLESYVAYAAESWQYESWEAEADDR